MSRDDVLLAIIGRVIRREGGVADVGDGAGETRWGQTPAWLERFGFPSPRNVAEAIENYRAWLLMTRLSDVLTVPDALSDNVVDWAVLSGHERAIRSLQGAIGARPDGVIGAATLTLLEASYRPALVRKVLGDRVRQFGRLATDQDNAKFLPGWANRLAELVEAL